MKTTATLRVPARELKMLRESLCSAQTALCLAGQANRTPGDVERLGLLIAEIDRHRPLGPDGSHGSLHTPTCGCEAVYEGDDERDFYTRSLNGDYG